MGFLFWLRRLYSLDTLDTRFTTPSNTPLKVAGDTRADRAGAETKAEGSGQGNGATRPRWWTLEFIGYYAILSVAVPMMFKAAVEVSQVSHPSYSSYVELLSPGWIPGRRVDNSDSQYSNFRDNIPYMLLLLILHACLRRVYNFYYPLEDATSSATPETKIKSDIPARSAAAAAADGRLEQRVSFDLYFALFLLTGLHGISALKVVLILYANYNITAKLPKKYIPVATWIFNVGILFANELFNGYQLTALAEFLFPVSDSISPEFLPSPVAWARWLDSLCGLVSRWEILFNITVLRLISYNLDYYWSLDYPSSSPLEKKQLDPSALSERDRVSVPAHYTAFNLRNYLAYSLYSPLYLTGPILTFNDYISQQRYPARSLNPTRTLLYGIRFLLSLLCMELLLHYVYVVAISKSSPDWSLYTPFQVSMIGFFNLHIIWLKLLLPWRFFRLWALIDGIDPPENMVRCMSDNYSALAFWRGWHRSYNRWIVRYLFIPLGGGGAPNTSKSSSPSTRNNILLTKLRPIANYLVVFTFVALWHDINLRLLMWGWLVTFFLLPEVLGTILFPARKWRSHPTAYRLLCSLGAVFNIIMMMAANLVGFALGFDGLKGLLGGIFGSYSGITFLVLASISLFVATQVMFEIREGELRAGIRLKC
ncbi:glycerol transporter [Arachnomyces sp. PD_36]|nr:glycerol transporter [Arachnomyces sp. PD_36]